MAYIFETVFLALYEAPSVCLRLPIYSIRAHTLVPFFALLAVRARWQKRSFSSHGVDFMIAHNNSSFIGQNNVPRVRVFSRRLSFSIPNIEPSRGKLYAVLLWKIVISLIPSD